jgi:hypothetical protein
MSTEEIRKTENRVKSEFAQESSDEIAARALFSLEVEGFSAEDRVTNLPYAVFRNETCFVHMLRNSVSVSACLS